jgi:hypothetical protein
MSKGNMTAGKRQRQEAKRAKAKAKVERREARQSAVPDAAEAGNATESQLMDELAELHRSLEAAEIAPEDFEERREQIRLQLEQLQ